VEDLLAGRRATYRLEKRYRHRNGDHILAQLTVSLVSDVQGAPSHFIAVVEDIRARKALEHQLQQSTERLSLAKRSARIGIHDYDTVTGEIEWDTRVRELWGVPHDLPVTYDVFINGVVPEDRPGVEQALAAAFDPAGDGIFASEYRIADAAGGTSWIAPTGSVQFDDGKPVRLVGTVRDITERKQAEAQRELLLQELGHRVNNMLSVVHGIVTLTARSTDSVAAFSHVISERVRSLTRTHALLLADTWESIPLHQLLREQLAAFQAGSSRIGLEGPDLRLPTRVVLPLGMVAHELATNAVKYGALGARGGEVAIAWDPTDGDDGCPMLRLSWVERGGPGVVPPVREGFGSRLMDLLIVKQLRGQLTQTFASDGLVAEITVPLDN
jgi:PAS domain S-box-containing protein